MRSKLKNTLLPITNLSEWIRHSFCALHEPIFRYYESLSRPSEKAISPNGMNDFPQAAKRSPPTGRPFSPEQTQRPRHTTVHSPLTHAPPLPLRDLALSVAVFWGDTPSSLHFSRQTTHFLQHILFPVELRVESLECRIVDYSFMLNFFCKRALNCSMVSLSLPNTDLMV